MACRRGKMSVKVGPPCRIPSPAVGWVVTAVEGRERAVGEWGDSSSRRPAV
jgi:hypothetical protein